MESKLLFIKVTGLNKAFRESTFPAATSVKDLTKQDCIFYITCTADDAALFGEQYKEGSTWIWAKGILVGDIDRRIPIVGMTETTAELQPGKFYVFDTVTDLTITLGTPESTEYLSEYMFQFTSGTTATTLSVPDTVTWIGDHAIAANKTYQCSIINGIGVLGGAE